MSKRNRKSIKKNEVTGNEEHGAQPEVASEQDVHGEMVPSPDLNADPSTDLPTSGDLTAASPEPEIEGETSALVTGDPNPDSTDEPAINPDPFAGVDGPESDIGDNEPTEEVKKTRQAAFSADAVITLLTESNPKKAGSQAHARFNNYKSGMTVKQALESGLRRDDLNWDAARNFIAINSDN